MAVPEQTPYKEYTANGSTTSFALGFICDSKNDLIVLVDNVAPPVATWSLVGNNAVFTTAPASGKKIILQRNTAMSRTTNYQSNNNSFRPETINKDIDRVWLKLQELGVADMLLKIYVERLHGEQKDYIDNKDQLVRNIISDLRNYVNQQDNGLANSINNLHSYVDQQDNNRNSYFENLISQQGVSLQQLDSYYKHLLQGMANIAADKGWLASLVTDASGKSQQEINDSAFRVNAKLLGIVPFLDATAQLEHYLNDSVTHEIYLPKGEYILSRKITINSIHPKKIVLEEGAVFKPDTAAGVVLFDIYSHLESENLSFDFDGKGCFIAVRYNPNCGTVRLKNTTFKNLKDVDATRATILLSVSAVGNFLDIDGVYFENCLKRGNEAITDSAGSLNGLYIHGATNLLGGNVDNIDVKNFHNINASDQIIIEDTAGLYVATGGLSIPLTVGKVTGTEFGKRLVKLQSSDVSIDYIDGISDTGDSWSVVGVLSEPNTFTGHRNRIGYVKARGNMDYAVADLCQDTKIGTADIEVYGSNSLNAGTFHAGLFVSGGSSGLKVTKLISKALRPISLNPASVADSIGNINITLAELTVIGAGTTAINIAGNASLTKGSINGLTIDKLILTNAGSSNISLMLTFASDLGYSDFDFKDVEIRAKLINNSIFLGFFQGVSNLYMPKVKYIDEVGQITTITDFIAVQNCKNVKIDNVDLPITSNRTFYVVNSSNVTIGSNMKLADATTGHVVNVGSTNVKVQSQDLKITDATNAGEIIRFSGTTAQRPKRAQAGFNYFDTTISKLITCSTSAIIDAAGNVTAPAVWSEVMMTKQASFSYDPPSIDAGESAQTFQTFSGVTIGTPVIAAFSVYDPGVEVSAVVSAANTVRINFKNIGTVPLDLGSGTITVKQI